MLFVGDTVGGSSAYVTIVSQWVITRKLQDLFPYLASKRTGVDNWWQVSKITVQTRRKLNEAQLPNGCVIIN